MSIAGGPRPSVRIASGNSWVPSAPTSRATCPSGSGCTSGADGARLGEPERVRQHRARISVDVAQPPLGVPPTRPTDAGDDDASWRPRAEAARQQQRHDPPGRTSRRHRPARTPRAATYSSNGNRPPAEPAGAEQQRRVSPRTTTRTTPADRWRRRASPRGRAASRSVCEPGQQLDRRGPGWVTRSRGSSRCRGQAVGIALAVGGELRVVRGGEVLKDQRMVDWHRRVGLRVARIRAQAVIQARGVARSHAGEFLTPGQAGGSPSLRARVVCREAMA